MDYEQSKRHIVEQANLYISNHRHYKWFQHSGSVYELETLKLLDIKGITTFAPLKEFPYLKSLEFGTTNSTLTIPDLVGLEQASHVERLAFVSKTKIKHNIEVIAQLSNLQSLGLYNVQQTLPAHLLSELTSLQSVSLSKHNYNSSASLPASLEEISITVDGLDTLPSIPPATGVKKVLLNGNRCQINTLHSFAIFPNVEEIKITAPKTLTDLSYVSKLQRLKVLDINFAPVSDLTALDQHPTIAEIRLRGSLVEQLDSITSCPALRTLYLEKSKLQSIANIRTQFPQLQQLWIWGTKVKDLSPLTDMSTLQNLDVTMLKPKSWDFLATLTGLEVLDLCKTSFADPQLLLELPNLKKVRLANSAVDVESDAYHKLEHVILARGGVLT
ncbi:hypothetical protein PQ456_03810 [Paenibacillus kyungheensis]|uniref:Leucine rich repeat (LRR) protein n=1 Tax=Paenibacillus kyungheensis TaxID=1452732 RepID=A0AAX3M487_9BACL|nr:hypothetical protein [Paenibacillus kyungheensis]WCT56658.1 hypothetical protein PQ456_03810 [Paenibacillus kyungheensis]